MATKKRGAASTGHAQVNVRMSRAELEMLEMLLSQANERARSAGVPDGITPGSLIRMWIREKATAASPAPAPAPKKR